MSLVVVGLNHNTCPVELRERLGFPANVIPGALLHLHKRIEGAGAVILSTCNRVEIYVHHPAPAEELRAQVRAFLSGWHNIPEAEFRETLYELEDKEAVGHLFRVASSLDSLVVGEVQILGQVHDAYLMAQAERVADKVIHALFQKAFAVAKRVRTQSNIGAGKVSVSSVAVDLAASIFMELARKAVMIIGSGEMAELALKSLVERGADRVLILNRNMERAQALAQSYDGEPIAFEDRAAHLHRADIIISSTAAPRFILHPEDFRLALARRGQKPMFVIDIAVPRDVDPAIGELDNVYLYNIDDLQQVVDDNLELRRQEIEHCMTIVDRSVEQFYGWMQALAAEPTIVSMAEELHVIRERELGKTLEILPDLTEKQRDEIRYMTERIVNTILQRPMSQIKQEIGHHDPKTVLHLVKRLFGLKEST